MITPARARFSFARDPITSSSSPAGCMHTKAACRAVSTPVCGGSHLLRSRFPPFSRQEREKGGDVHEKSRLCYTFRTSERKGKPAKSPGISGKRGAYKFIKAAIQGWAEESYIAGERVAG